MKQLLCLFFVLFYVCSYSQELLDAQLSACDRKAIVELIRPRISKKEFVGDTLFLSLGFSANCCISPDPKIELRNDTLFIQKGNKSDSYCMCDCCFELDLTILGVRATDVEVNVDGRIFEYSESPYVKLPDEYEFDRKTKLNQGNSDNLKVGLWRTYYEGTNVLHLEQYFAEDWEEPIRKWYKKYDQQGNLQEVGIRSMPKGTMLVMDAREYNQLLERIKAL